MLMRMPGSVGLYHADAFTPAGEAEPPPVTLRLMHCAQACQHVMLRGPGFALAVSNLRVVLSPVLAARTVERNKLMAENVAARCKGRGDRDVPLQVVAHQLVGRPGLRACGEALLSDLEEAEIARLSGRAAAGALG